MGKVIVLENKDVGTYTDLGCPEKVCKGTIVIDPARKHIIEAKKDIIFSTSHHGTWDNAWKELYSNANVISNTEITRKVYPDAEQFGDYLIIKDK